MLVAVLVILLTIKPWAEKQFAHACMCVCVCLCVYAHVGVGVAGVGGGDFCPLRPHSQPFDACKIVIHLTRLPKILNFNVKTH